MCALNKAEPIHPTGFEKSRAKQAKMKPRFDAFMRHPKFIRDRIEDDGNCEDKYGMTSMLKIKDVDAHYAAWK